MGHLSPRGVRIRRERLAWAAWSLLALFIVAGSSGTWSPYRPGIWAPTLINLGDVARNVALYVPFGIFGMLSLRRSDARGVARVTAIAILFSVAVEALQLYTVDRVASLTDIVSAGVGTASGAALAALVFPPK
jgi:VanZ family protein